MTTLARITSTTTEDGVATTISIELGDTCPYNPSIGEDLISKVKTTFLEMYGYTDEDVE